MSDQSKLNITAALDAMAFRFPPVDDALRERVRQLAASLLPMGLSGVAGRIADQEAAIAHARTLAGDEVVDVCSEWAKTTVLQNSDAFDICWRTGGPSEAERSVWYLDAIDMFERKFRYR